MTVAQIYDAVLTVLHEKGKDRLNQRPFFLFLNKRIAALLAAYPHTALPKGVVQPRIDELCDPVLIKDCFFFPLVWGILYDAGAGPEYLADADKSAKEADRTARRQGQRYIYKRRF